MRINATERTRAAGSSKAKNKSGSGMFTLQTDSTGENAAPKAAVAAHYISSVDSLIALQGSDDYRGARKAATERADALLDILSDVRLRLLEGALPLHDLQRLKATLQRARANTGDGQLESILNEIELRAQVEMAKLDSQA